MGNIPGSFKVVFIRYSIGQQEVLISCQTVGTGLLNIPCLYVEPILTEDADVTAHIFTLPACLARIFEAFSILDLVCTSEADLRTHTS